jgi:hypothetical protein
MSMNSAIFWSVVRRVIRCATSQVLENICMHRFIFSSCLNNSRKQTNFWSRVQILKEPICFWPNYFPFSFHMIFFPNLIFAPRYYGVMVSTSDSESGDPSFNLGRTLPPFLAHFLIWNIFPGWNWHMLVTFQPLWNWQFWPWHIPAMLKLATWNPTHVWHNETDNFDHSTFQPCWNWHFRPQLISTIWKIVNKCQNVPK